MREVIRSLFIVRRPETGQSLIELMITIGLMAVLLPALLVGFIAARSGRAQSEQRQVAIARAREDQEAARVVREKDWSAFALLTTPANTTYYPLKASGTWTLTTTVQPLPSGMTSESIKIADVFRDSASDAIVATCVTGCYNDSSTKLVTVTVSWTTPIPSSVSTTEYLTRNGNLSYTETTVSTSPTNFTPNSILTNTVVRATTGTFTDDGEVALGPGGTFSNWCTPASTVIASQPLNAIPISIVASSPTTGSNDIAFTTSGNNAAGGNSDAVDKFTINRVSNPTISPAGSNTEAKSYGLFADDTYVYFNQSNPPKHTIRIAKASDLTKVGVFDAASSGTGTSVYVSGSYGYTTVGNKLYSFTVSAINPNTPDVSLPSPDNVGLTNNGKKVIVANNKAYVITDGSSNQLKIIPLLSGGKFDKANVVSVSLSNSQPGVDIAMDLSGNYIYAVTTYPPSGATPRPDIYVVRLSDNTIIKTLSTDILSGLGAGSMNPQGVTVVSADRIIVFGCNDGSSCTVSSPTSWNYQVFDVSIPGSASRCGGTRPSYNGVFAKSINGVAGITQQGTGNVYSYIVYGSNTNAVFQIIQGGPGGSATYTDNGTFESKPFDAAHASAFNQITANVSGIVFGVTQAKMQVGTAVANAGSCSTATYTFVGPDGSTSSYYTPISGVISGTIPLGNISPSYINPEQCFRYMLYLSTTNSNQTPVVSDVKVNYSP